MCECKRASDWTTYQDVSSTLCSTAPDDYNPTPTPNPVQFLAGDGPLTQQSSTFAIVDDSVVEPQEFFSVTGSVTAAFVTFANGQSTDTVVVNIVDNDRKWTHIVIMHAVVDQLK